MSKFLVFLARGNNLGYLGKEGFTERTSDASRFKDEDTALEAFEALEDGNEFNANIIYELIDNHGFASVRIINERTK